MRIRGLLFRSCLINLILIFFITLIVHLIHGICLIFNLLNNSSDMLSPFEGGVSHTKVYFSLILHITIIIFLSYFHGPIEMLCCLVIVSFLCQDFSELHVSSRLSLPVFELV